MRYVKWKRPEAGPDEPVETYSVYGDDDFDIEAFEVYANGEVRSTDPADGVGKAELGEKPWPEPDQVDIEAAPRDGIYIEIISRDEYEKAKRYFVQRTRQK